MTRHPQCPHCGGRRTKSITYGMPFEPQSWGPWQYMGGCCPQDAEWHCDVFDYEWT